MRRLLLVVVLAACGSSVEPESSATTLVSSSDTAGDADLDPPGPSECSPLSESCKPNEVCAESDSGFAFYCEPSGGAGEFEPCDANPDCAHGLTCWDTPNFTHPRVCIRWCSMLTGSPCPSICDDVSSTAADDLELGVCLP